MKLKRLKAILEWSQLPGVPMYTGIPNSTGSVSALPYDAWDNSVHGLKSPLDALSLLMQNVNDDPSLANLVGGITQIADKIERLVIMRVVRNEENMRLDVQLRITINGREFWVILSDFDGECNMKSEIDTTSLRFNKEFMIRLKGLLKKVLDNWFIPKEGNYEVLKDFICHDWLGKRYTIHAGSLIVVLDNPNRDVKKEIRIRCKNVDMVLDGKGYYFFKYWTKNIG